MKRFAFAACAALLLVAGGCDKEKTRLRVYTWDSYLDPNIVLEYEADYLRRTGKEIEVEVFIFEENELMIDRVRKGEVYDLVCPTDYTASAMITENLLQPINHSKILDKSSYSPWLTGFAFDPENTYTVPFSYGTTGIAFNAADSNVHRADMRSWSALWDKKYDQQIMMKDNNYELFFATLAYVNSPMLLALCDNGARYTQAFADTLKSLFSRELSPEMVQRVKQALYSQKKIVMGYYAAEGKVLLSDGEGSVAHTWSSDAVYAMKRNRNIEFFVPYEGSMFYVDSWVIPANALHVAEAHDFLKFLARPDVAKRNMLNSGAPSAIDAVMESYKQELAGDTAFFAGKSAEWKQQYMEAQFLSQDIIQRCTEVQANPSMDEVMDEFWLNQQQHESSAEQ